MRILHLAHAGTWEAALETTGNYNMSTKGATLDSIGFIHAATPEQLPEVAERVYGGDPEPLILLELETDLIEADGVEVKFEEADNGQQYPHIYGPIKPQYVVSTLPAGFDAEGRFTIER